MMYKTLGIVAFLFIIVYTINVVYYKPRAIIVKQDNEIVKLENSLFKEEENNVMLNSNIETKEFELKLYKEKPNIEEITYEEMDFSVGDHCITIK